MTYVVLARKWRPQRFGDIVGQGHVTRILTHAILAGRIAHCYLFTGVRGVGKTTAARILAKALNCEGGPIPDPCNTCTHCLEIMNGNSLDVYEIDGASNRGIDEVRQIIENVRYQPAKSRFKIYIIDEVHQVTKDAFNALLKTLEEPPAFVKFILATTEPHRLPETILSRCQQFDFRRIPLRDIARRLRQIAEAEKLRITEGALFLIAREAEGSMRDAQSLLEQVLSSSAPVTEEGAVLAEVDEGHLRDILGIAERKILYELSGAVIAGRPDRCVELVADVTAHGLDLARLSRELVEHFRNLLVARLAMERGEQGEDRAAGSSVSDTLFDLPGQEIEDLVRQGSDIPVSTLMDYLRLMCSGDEEVSRSPYPRFALEATLVQLATLPTAMPIGEAISRLESLERELLGRRESKADPGRKGGSASAEPGAQSAHPGPRGEDDKEEVWEKFVAFVMKEKRFLASHLKQVCPLELGRGQLKIGVGERHHLNYLQDPENLSILKTFAQRFFAKEVAVTVSSLASLPAGSGNRTTASAETAGGEANDVVKDALQIFGGSIKEIKRNA